MAGRPDAARRRRGAGRRAVRAAPARAAGRAAAGDRGPAAVGGVRRGGPPDAWPPTSSGRRRRPTLIARAAGLDLRAAAGLGAAGLDAGDDAVGSAPWTAWPRTRSAAPPGTSTPPTCRACCARPTSRTRCPVAGAREALRANVRAARRRRPRGHRRRRRRAGGRTRRRCAWAAWRWPRRARRPRLPVEARRLGDPAAARRRRRSCSRGSLAEPAWLVAGARRLPTRAGSPAPRRRCGSWPRGPAPRGRAALASGDREGLLSRALGIAVAGRADDPPTASRALAPADDRPRPGPGGAAAAPPARDVGRALVRRPPGRGAAAGAVAGGRATSTPEGLARELGAARPRRRGRSPTRPRLTVTRPARAACCAAGRLRPGDGRPSRDGVDRRRRARRAAPGACPRAGSWPPGFVDLQVNGFAGAEVGRRPRRPRGRRGRPPARRRDGLLPHARQPLRRRPTAGPPPRSPRARVPAGRGPRRSACTWRARS